MLRTGRTIIYLSKNVWRKSYKIQLKDEGFKINYEDSGEYYAKFELIGSRIHMSWEMRNVTRMTNLSDIDCMNRTLSVN